MGFYFPVLMLTVIIKKAMNVKDKGKDIYIK